MTVFFTGCTHFGHGAIINLAKRPFDSVEQMDAELIYRWNSVVRNQDLVYHLGDVAFGDPHEYLAQCNGRKVVIRGNHDRKIGDHEYLEVPLSSRRFVMFHYPIEEWNHWYRNSIHVHCHVHSPKRITANNRVNVSVEAWDYAPVSVARVLDAVTVTEGGS